MNNYNKDSITAIAEKKGWVLKLRSGHWIIYEPISLLLQDLNDYLYKKIGEPLNFEKILFPKIIPLSLFSLYGAEFYPSNIAFKVTNTHSELILDPALTSLYSSLANSKISVKRLPFLFTEVGISYSYRSEKIDLLNEFCTSNEFAKTEYIIIGSSNTVEETLKYVVKKFWAAMKFLRLQLNSETKYIINNSNNQKLQIDEILVSTNDKNKIEIASFADRKSVITERYNIKNERNEKLCSGFLSIGLYRIIYCILDQYGFNPKNWPKLK